MADMREMVDYMEEYHRDSNLNDIKFDRASTVKVLEYYILSTDSLALLSFHNDKINGMLIASLEPFFFNKRETYATDLFFISNGAGPRLWKKFKEWAFASGAKRIVMGVSSGDARAGQLLEALGMETTGGMYVLR